MNNTYKFLNTFQKLIPRSSHHTHMYTHTTVCLSPLSHRLWESQAYPTPECIGSPTCTPFLGKTWVLQHYWQLCNTRQLTDPHARDKVLHEVPHAYPKLSATIWVQAAPNVPWQSCCAPPGQRLWCHGVTSSSVRPCPSVALTSAMCLTMTKFCPSLIFSDWLLHPQFRILFQVP